MHVFELERRQHHALCDVRYVQPIRDSRLSCLSQSYGKETSRAGLGQGIPFPMWNAGELRRQLRMVEGANLTEVVVFIAPSLYTSVE